MDGQILVPLRRGARIGEIIPYLEQIAKPGTRVVFLVRYPKNGIDWLLGYIEETMLTGIQAMLAATKMAESYSMEEQGWLEDEKIYSLPEVWRERGVEIAFNVYGGSLRKALKSYTRNGDVRLIMIPAGSGNPMARLMRWIIRLFVSCKPSHFPPMLLLHPGREV